MQVELNITGLDGVLKTMQRKYKGLQQLARVWAAVDAVGYGRRGAARLGKARADNGRGAIREGRPFYWRMT